MAISKEQRRRINRQNATLSTGPRTEAGKKISSRNSFKHGLRIETLALPDEDAFELRDRLDQWNDFYRPATPGEAELIDLAVFASVQRRRCQRSTPPPSPTKSAPPRTAGIRTARTRSDASSPCWPPTPPPPSDSSGAPA